MADRLFFFLIFYPIDTVYVLYSSQILVVVFYSCITKFTLEIELFEKICLIADKRYDVINLHIIE